MASQKRTAFGLASMTEVIDMHGGDCSVTWLVDRMIEHQAPCLLHAPSKCCKTTLALDLAIACATGGDWLGRKTLKTPCMVVSVENGAKSLINTIGLICKSRGVSVPKDTLHLGTQHDSISDDAVLLEITDYMRRHSVGLAIFDPAYLILGDYKQTEMNDVGGKLYRISSACQNAGATCMFLHHSKNGGGKGLRAAAGAGFANWPSSWMSVSRLGVYNLDGKHRLRMEYGGRWAQQGTISIKIDEGLSNDMSTKCDVLAADMPQQGMLFPVGTEEAQKTRQHRKRLTDESVLSAIKNSKKPLSARAIQAECGGSRERISEIVSTLVGGGKVRREGQKYVYNSGN